MPLRPDWAAAHRFSACWSAAVGSGSPRRRSSLVSAWARVSVFTVGAGDGADLAIAESVSAGRYDGGLLTNPVLEAAADAPSAEMGSTISGAAMARTAADVGTSAAAHPIGRWGRRRPVSFNRPAPRSSTH